MLRLALALSAVAMATFTAAGADTKPMDDLTVAFRATGSRFSAITRASRRCRPEQMKQVTVVFDKNEYFLYFKDKDHRRASPRCSGWHS